MLPRIASLDAGVDEEEPDDDQEEDDEQHRDELESSGSRGRVGRRLASAEHTEDGPEAEERPDQPTDEEEQP